MNSVTVTVASHGHELTFMNGRELTSHESTGLRLLRHEQARTRAGRLRGPGQLEFRLMTGTRCVTRSAGE
jgi:hypothetical protein